MLYFRKGNPDFKALQAVLPRVERRFLITEGREETKRRARGKCNREDRLSQVVNAEMRLRLPPQDPKSESRLLHGGTPVSCLRTRHTFVQGTCCKFPRFLSPPFSANAFHTPSLPPGNPNPWIFVLPPVDKKHVIENKQTNK